jgi:hypothetical protein
MIYSNSIVRRARALWQICGSWLIPQYYPTLQTALGIETLCSSLNGVIQCEEIYIALSQKHAVIHDPRRLNRRLKNISKKMASLDAE